jgi:hypothetical protein
MMAEAIKEATRWDSDHLIQYPACGASIMERCCEQEKAIKERGASLQVQDGEGDIYWLLSRTARGPLRAMDESNPNSVHSWSTWTPSR